jgi:hypothetical protein
MRSNLDRLSRDGPGGGGFTQTKAGGITEIEHGGALAAPRTLVSTGAERHSDA